MAIFESSCLRGEVSSRDSKIHSIKSQVWNVHWGAWVSPDATISATKAQGRKPDTWQFAVALVTDRRALSLARSHLMKPVKIS